MLDEWQSGHLVVRPFEIGKYSKTFNDISNHITYTLTQEAHSEQIADRFRVWAEERYVMFARLVAPLLNDAHQLVRAGSL